MAWYLDKVSEELRSSLRPGEVLIGAVPADRPLQPDPREGRDGSAPTRGSASRGTGVLVQTHAAAPDVPFEGRMILAATDQRLRIYSRRRWRALPGQHLADIPIDGLGNIEAVLHPANGAPRLELVVILSDGVAVPLAVPNGHTDRGKEFVRRVQVLLID